MNATDVASILVSLIAAAAAIAAGRSASKASVRTTEIESRTQLETEAYNRARKYDTDTIERQDTEIEELREANRKLSEEIAELQKANRQLGNLILENDTLKAEITRLRARVHRLEDVVPGVEATEPPEEDSSG